ncbi:MAG: hypothetical protein IJ043_10220 [Clostridia bacterium]|nr:hypothetical protein [Clostridia bacterium]
MKKIIALAAAVVVIIAGVIFVPKLMHTCDSCDKFFIGTGYEANFVSEALSKESQTICENCAEEQHSISITLGKDLSDFRKKLF